MSRPDARLQVLRAAWTVLHGFTFLNLFTKNTQWLFPLTYLILFTGRVLIEISITHKKLDESFKENVCELFLYLQNIFIFKFYFA